MFPLERAYRAQDGHSGTPERRPQFLLPLVLRVVVGVLMLVEMMFEGWHGVLVCPQMTGRCGLGELAEGGVGDAGCQRLTPAFLWAVLQMEQHARELHLRKPLVLQEHCLLAAWAPVHQVVQAQRTRCVCEWRRVAHTAAIRDAFRFGKSRH
mmetsp:Transcript_11393/g.20620  ORF Transcript_11393/g.20620 Transcript_11393/m.20620 type:complete len:152 (+) Transcript_11393:669-1124(+)